ncbi:MAG: hemerythrin domain-containing protein [Dehalococcoidales bacterium]|nr:hemerythrin domain-containing protein [Dehalococcoidales bacterium]
MEFNIPTSLQLEHKELHAELAKAIAVPGKLGKAAQNVATVLEPHFKKEEEYALPPLGLLPILAGGKIRPEMRAVLLMTDRLKADLPHMLEEHKTIVTALHDLIQEARKARLSEHERFAEELILHAKNEEEVLYPAALLVGQYIKLNK